MHFLSFIKDSMVDFLFPKSTRALRLETLSVNELTTLLPQAENLKGNTLALFDYSNPLVKEIIWELKYGGNTLIAGKLAEIIYDHLQNELGELGLFESSITRMGQPLLMPIPVSDKRRLERGWNQSEILCEKVVSCDHEKVFRYIPSQLIKFRHTESQTKTTGRKERLKNLANSMRIRDREEVAGKFAIVLDDVTTTGSTFAEARRALRAAGAKKILCVAVAH